MSALMGCQGGVFFLEGVGDASGDLLRGPVHTLVGEYGSFMHMGRAVPAAGSVVVLLLRLDGAEAGGER